MNDCRSARRRRGLLRRPAWAVALLALCLLGGCASPGADGGQPPASSGKGRYIETEISLPKEQQYPLLLSLDERGEPELLAAGEDSISWYRRENGSFTRTEPAWQSELPEGYQPAGAVKGEEGRLWLLYAELQEEGEVLPHLYEADEAAGTLRELPLEAGETPLQMIDGLQLLSDGSLLIDTYPAGILHYSPEGRLLQSYSLNHSGFAALGDSLFIAPYSEDALTELDLHSADEKGQRPCPAASSTILFTEGDALYAANSSGLFRIGEQAYETMLEGGRYRMASQNFALAQAAKRGDTVAILYTDLRDYTPALCLYTFDPHAAAATRTLRVQSLYDFELVREAASEMQRRDPDLTVQVEALLAEGSGMTVSDAIKLMNTELLAGRGADVYILDGMPLRSLSEKGVLLELSDLVQPHTGSGEWLPNIAESLRGEKGLFALPVKFGIPVLWGDAQVTGAGKSLSSLVDFAKKNPEESLFYAMHPKNLIQRFFPVCAPGFQDADGTIGQAAFQEFLEAVGALAASAPGTEYQEPGSGMDGSMEVPAYHEHRCRAIAQEVLSSRLLSIDRSASADRGEEGDFVPLPGMEEAVFIPHIIAGINAKSGCMEDARALLEVMLEEGIQTIDYSSYEGLPVHAQALESLICVPDSEQPPLMVGYGMEDDDLVLIKVDHHPSGEMQQRFLALCRAARTPSLADPVLLEMVEEETAAYFAEEQSAEEATAALIARTQAYLNE